MKPKQLTGDPPKPLGISQQQIAARLDQVWGVLMVLSARVAELERD
jgi:hypothetical protein